jgi:formylglycine-generating enzyme required for sulfatase activity
VIEIAHEALLKSWDALKEWIKKSQGDLLLIQDIEREADSWAKEKAKAADLAGGARIRKELEVDRLRLKPQELLDQFYTAVENVLGLPRENLLALSTRGPKAVTAGASGGSGTAMVNSEDVAPAHSSPASNGTPFSADVLAFIRREPERLIEELGVSLLDHQRRADIGERLAQLDDRRPGVALDEKGLPDIEWLPVPEGKVTLVDKEGRSIDTFEVKRFYIARYPVTMRQFDVFSKPKIYYDKRWWKGLEIDPERHGPELQKPGTANHPAQFVSWFQGVAFCRWLTHELGYIVRLPTEWEWQMAATGGHEDYEYPWGKWDATRANFRQGVYKLMSVGMYPDGRSPIGAYDMSGNMYEWCANEFDNPAKTGTSGTSPRTTRGGAFFSDEADLRVTHRLRDIANGMNELGKRIAVCIRLAADAPTKEIATD